MKPLIRVLWVESLSGKARIAPRPFVEWTPGDPETHLRALASQASECRPFRGPQFEYTVGVFYFPVDEVQAYIAVPPSTDSAAAQNEFQALLDGMLVDRLAEPRGGDWDRWVPTEKAALSASTFLHLVAIYLRLRDQRPDRATGWQGVNMFANEKQGGVPDALILDANGKPVLAIGYACRTVDLAAFHGYCRDHSLPYQIWGSLFDRGWYNPYDAKRSQKRLEVLQQFGPLKAIPAIARVELPDNT